MNNEHRVKGIPLAMHRGPYQNNGATPWYSTLHVGTPGQPLKLSLDTGTNITWVTSSLCAADRCQHYSAGRFDYQASSSFTFTDCLQRPYSFGPWGTMQVESGADVLHVNQTTLPTQLLLAADYNGAQFRQLDWDGGIGLPSSSAYVDGPSSTRSSSQPFDTAPRPLSHAKLIFSATAKAQAPSRPMSAAGTWQNDYGSVMTLTVEGNRICGTYQSSTGSTGQYAVTGYQTPTTIRAEQGLPIALAIEWHSLGDDPSDPSWNWSSGLSGQILRVKDQDRLTLSHLLVATRDFPGLADQGTYVDKLLYHRVAYEPEDPPLKAPISGPDIEDPLSGTWAAAEGSRLSLRVHAGQRHAFGYVSGTLSADTGEAEVSGFTDINARASGLALQSVSLTAAGLEGATTLCLSGSVDLKDHSLNVLVMASSPTTVAHSYVQTQVKSLTFYRQDAQTLHQTA